LIEVVVCVAIIAVISTIAMSSMRKTDSTKAAVVARIATQINDAAMVYKHETGRFPQEQPKGVMPPELAPYFPENIFGNETPIGGKWDWNGEGVGSFALGISVSYEGESGLPRGLLKSVDRLVDDGNIESGVCVLKTVGERRILQFSLAEGNP
jgi:type II secretory pathway pseudopilin PulG